MEAIMRHTLSTSKNLTLIAILMFSARPFAAAQTDHKEKPNAPVGPNQFTVLAQQCAPDVPVITLRAIARAESAFRPYALSLNYPKRTAAEQGLHGGEMFL